MVGTLIPQLPDAEHLGSEAAADRVQEILQRGVAGSFGRGAAGGAYPPQVP